jgi:3-phenylpropionate/cinnamic acid dioxygenase small subunit
MAAPDEPTMSATVSPAANLTMTRSEAEEFLYREARLLDELQLEEWLKLFTKDGVYWIPIDDTKPRDTSLSIVCDPPLRREERVYHLLHTHFPSQTPRSRTIHLVGNVEIGRDPASAEIAIRSNQVIHEIRGGDFRQTGLGELRALVATVEHRLRPEDGALKIALKKIRLIDRDMPLGNLTFII